MKIGKYKTYDNYGNINRNNMKQQKHVKTFAERVRIFFKAVRVHTYSLFAVKHPTGTVSGWVRNPNTSSRVAPAA